MVVLAERFQFGDAGFILVLPVDQRVRDLVIPLQLALRFRRRKRGIGRIDCACKRRQCDESENPMASVAEIRRPRFAARERRLNS